MATQGNLSPEEKLRKKFHGYKFGQDCVAHTHNSFVPLEDHHVHPKEYHGPDIKKNLVRVCSNGHGEIHYYLELLLATGKTRIVDAIDAVPIDVRRRFGVKVQHFASAGFIGIMKSEVTESGLNVT